MKTLPPKADFIFDWRFLVSTALFSVVLFEAHELAHVLTGYVMCGGFGPRDFNVWSLAEGCSVFLPGYMGPIFTIGTGYVAAMMLFSERAALRAFGIALFWAGAPVSRLLQSLYFGGGDEIFGLYNFMELQSVDGGWDKAQLVGRISLFLVSWPLIVLLWWRLKRRHSWAWVIAIILAGEILSLATSFLVHKPLMGSGLLHQGGPMGAPWIVTITFIVFLVLTALTFKWMFRVPQVMHESDN